MFTALKEMAVMIERTNELLDQVILWQMISLAAICFWGLALCWMARRK